jgi:hypothetical protein
VAGARQVGAGTGDQAAGAAFGGGQQPAAPAQGGQFFNDFGRWPACILRSSS